MVKRADPNPAYWDEYTPFQQVKHDLIRNYLNGWYPKLGSWAGRVLYVDTHAGRGKYETGDPGSPVIALQTLLNHASRDRLLAESEFNFLFIERDPQNLAALRVELTKLSPLPRQAIPLLARNIGAKWWTSAVRMVTGGQATRYLLLHLTNSDHGRDLIKECSWKVFPDGQFVARKSDNPDQPFLFEQEPNLSPLRAWVLAKLSQGPRRWRDLHDEVRSEWWLPKHVNAMLKQLRNDGTIKADPVPGKTPGLAFTATANPVLRLARP
jgi:hypothetical protein